MQAARNGEALRAVERRASALRSPHLVFPDAVGWHAVERRVRRLPPAGGVLCCLWSAAALPLRDASVDVALVDLPFGKAHKVGGGPKNGLQTLYQCALCELARVLAPGSGRLVLLSMSRRVLGEMHALQAELWEEVHVLRVNCGGGLGWVTMWRRTAQPYSPPPPRAKKKKGSGARRATADGGAAPQLPAGPLPIIGAKERARRATRDGRAEARATAGRATVDGAGGGVVVGGAVGSALACSSGQATASGDATDRRRVEVASPGASRSASTTAEAAMGRTVPTSAEQQERASDQSATRSRPSRGVASTGSVDFWTCGMFGAANCCLFRGDGALRDQERR